MKKELKEKMLLAIFTKTGGRPENKQIADICAEVAVNSIPAIFWEGRKFQRGDIVEVASNGNESFLKHFLEIGEMVEIMDIYRGKRGWSSWKGVNAYWVKIKSSGRTYSEPLLEEELKFKELTTNQLK